jgi:hypothetical protein
VVSAYEAGKRRLDLVEFLLIARTLGADPVEIFADLVLSETPRDHGFERRYRRHCHFNQGFR